MKPKISTETRYYEYMGMSTDQLCKVRDEITLRPARYRDARQRIAFIAVEMLHAYRREEAA